MMLDYLPKCPNFLVYFEPVLTHKRAVGLVVTYLSLVVELVPDLVVELAAVVAPDLVPALG